MLRGPMVPISTFIESKMSTRASYPSRAYPALRPEYPHGPPPHQPWTQLHTAPERERIRPHGIRPTHKTELYAPLALWYNVLTKDEVLVVRRTTNTTL